MTDAKPTRVPFQANHSDEVKLALPNNELAVVPSSLVGQVRTPQNRLAIQIVCWLALLILTACSSPGSAPGATTAGEESAAMGNTVTEEVEPADEAEAASEGNTVTEEVDPVNEAEAAGEGNTVTGEASPSDEPAAGDEPVSAPTQPESAEESAPAVALAMQVATSTSTPNYPDHALDKVGDRMVAGDFNGDGRGDIATFYDYDKGAAAIHVFRSNGNIFEYDNGDAGWWGVPSGYTLGNVGDRMVAGDFNGDGRDDIATFYDYDKGAATIHVFRSNGSSFVYDNGSAGWWGVPRGYTLGNVGDRMVAGDFNDDGKHDLATLYDYDKGAARIHVFRSSGSSFVYANGSAGWWSVSKEYALSQIGGRIVSDNFDGRANDSIATFFDSDEDGAVINTFKAFKNCLSTETKKGNCYSDNVGFPDPDTWAYGRHCGPNHKGGKAAPIDIIDQACQVHDADDLWKVDGYPCANDWGFYHTVRQIRDSGMFSLNEVQLDTANQILTAFDLKLSLPSDVNVDFQDPFNPAVSGRICGIDDLAANDRTFDFFDNYAFHFTRNP